LVVVVATTSPLESSRVTSVPAAPAGAGAGAPGGGGGPTGAVRTEPLMEAVKRNASGWRLVAVVLASMTLVRVLT
jgi:hypothetical protein